MPISLQSSLMFLSKLAPWSLRSLDGALEIEMYLCHRNLATVFSLRGGHICHDMFPKVVTKDQKFSMFGGWSNSIVVSMLVKSTCSNSKGMVTMISHIGALVQLPSCWMQLSQLLIAFCICVAIPGHQNWSCGKHNIYCWHWCPASQWHPFMAAT